MTYKEQLISIREQIQNLILEHPDTLAVEGDELANTLVMIEKAIRLENPVEKLCNHFGCTLEHLERNSKIHRGNLYIFVSHSGCTTSIELIEDAIRGYHLSPCASDFSGVLEPAEWMKEVSITVDTDGWWAIVDLDFYLSQLD